MQSWLHGSHNLLIYPNKRFGNRVKPSWWLAVDWSPTRDMRRRFATASSSRASPAMVETATADAHQTAVEATATSAPRAAVASSVQPPGHAHASAASADAATAAAPDAEHRRSRRGNGFHSRTASLFGKDLSIADLAVPQTPAGGMNGAAASTLQAPQQPSAAAEQTAEVAQQPGDSAGSARNGSFSFPDLAARSEEQSSPAAAETDSTPTTPQAPDAEKAVGLQPGDNSSGSSNSSGKHVQRKSRCRLELPPWQA